MNRQYTNCDGGKTQQSCCDGGQASDTEDNLSKEELNERQQSARMSLQGHPANRYQPNPQCARKTDKCEVAPRINNMLPNQQQAATCGAPRQQTSAPACGAPRQQTAGSCTAPRLANDTDVSLQRCPAQQRCPSQNSRMTGACPAQEWCPENKKRAGPCGGTRGGSAEKKNQGCRGPSPPRCGAPTRSTPDCGAPARSTPDCGAPARSTPDCGAPARSRPQCGAPAQSAPKCGGSAAKSTAADVLEVGLSNCARSGGKCGVTATSGSVQQKSAGQVPQPPVPCTGTKATGEKCSGACRGECNTDVTEKKANQLLTLYNSKRVSKEEIEKMLANAEPWVLQKFNELMTLQARMAEKTKSAMGNSASGGCPKQNKDACPNRNHRNPCDKKKANDQKDAYDKCFDCVAEPPAKGTTTQTTAAAPVKQPGCGCSEPVCGGGCPRSPNSPVGCGNPAVATVGKPATQQAKKSEGTSDNGYCQDLRYDHVKAKFEKDQLQARSMREKVWTSSIKLA